MGFINFYLKLKAFRFRRLLNNGGDEDHGEKRSFSLRRNRSISHGNQSIQENWSSGDEKAHDIVVTRKVYIQGNELRFFGISEPRIGDEIIKKIEERLFNETYKQWHLKRKSNEILRKAHLDIKAKLIRDEQNSSEKETLMNSATAIVINEKKLVLANMGIYKAILCRNGKAHQISDKKVRGFARPWSRKLIPGTFRKPKLRLLIHGLARPGTQIKPSRRTSENIAVESHRIDPRTEFVILGNAGIWEVMKYQEAVGLIGHIEDPQEAAECLAKEASARMSKNFISCLIIRFD